MDYRRDIFEKEFKNIKKQLHQETKNYHTDTYTGKQLIPGGVWDFEHIISAKEFSSLPNVEKLDFDTQSKILNHPENIGFTERIINKSKSKYDLIEWLERKSNGRDVTNADFYKIDIKNAKKLRSKTVQFLQSEIEKFIRN